MCSAAPRVIHLRGLALDRSANTAQGRAFKLAKGVEHRFARQLRKVARHIADLIEGFDLTQADVADRIQAQMEAYAKLLDPWARSVSTRMIAEVNSRDLKGWRETSKRIGLGLQAEIRESPTGRAMQKLLDEQTVLITSLPRDAAQRVREVTLAGISQGRRPSAYIDEIMRTGEVTRSRATLIATTEVSRTATTLTQVRAQSIGSEGYIWRTAKDSRVRPSHRKMEGRFVPWNDPPILDGLTGHAGCLPRCRCIVEAVIPLG